MEEAQAKIVRAILVLALLIGASIGLMTLQTEQAHAYAYAKTDTGAVFNRSWIMADSSGYIEFIGADPHGPRANMAPDYWSDYVSAYQFSVTNASTLKWKDYTVGNGTWSRGGATFGHLSLDAAKNGTGFGCLATFGYGWGGNCASVHGGLDALMYSHVWITDTVWGKNYYGAADFWPRVKIVYDKNTTAAVGNLPGSHHKYIGNTGTIAAAKPTRAGYSFEGWSLKKGGAVQIAAAQKIGYMDWNLKKYMTMAHSWDDNGPADVRDDAGTGIPSPTGTNTITLYAVWKPITYTVTYNGNGATTGTTASSSHTYDAAKELTANGYSRSYTLTCDAQGGSAGTTSLACAWGWRHWSTNAAGAGTTYANKASVKNLRSAAGAITLYAQWSKGVVELPDPGEKPDCVFEGWYTAAAGGSLVGNAGEHVSIDRNATYYARWKQLVRVSYYVDGSSEPVHVEMADVGAGYTPSEQATTKAGKADCAGFEGWYADAACSTPFADKTPVPSSGLALYGRNRVTLSYEFADQSKVLFAEHECYADETLSTLLPEGAVLPLMQTGYYGDRVSVARGASIWFEERARAREAVCDLGAYATAAAEGAPSPTLKLTCNTLAYLRWRVPLYDGIALS